MDTSPNEMTLLNRVLEIHSKTALARYLDRISPGKWNATAITRWLQGKAGPRLTEREYAAMLLLLPPRPAHYDRPAFDFIDLFAGIGGLRRGFEQAGGRCVLSSEWNAQALRTYRANHYADPAAHAFIGDIRDITLSHRENILPKQVASHIRQLVPPHDVLLAGFPCQPFSIAGVSKKKSLGRLHGFEDKTQGTLFFDVARILQVMQPAAFVLENVKNLKSHDQGNTFRIILETLDELGYHVADAEYSGSADPKIIDARHFVPQHRERIVLAGLRRDLSVHEGFTLGDIHRLFPARPPRFGDILEPEVDDKYILTPALWTYLHHYALRHRARGNGFGYGLTGAADVARTLSARYYKDGSEILVDRGFDPALDFHHPRNQRNRPRRLTPRECARLMGFDSPQGSDFRIPVSDMQAYKQFGNSVVVPVFAAVAQLMKPRLLQAIHA